MTVQLFPDQVAFEDDIRASYAAGNKRVLAVAPTGFGKTIVFSHMARLAVDRGNDVAIWAHRAELIDQIGQALAKFGVSHGYQAPGFAPNPLASVQVCSIQAGARRVDRLLRRPYKFNILDEAHHAAEGTSAHAIINAQPNSRWLGVTATPLRLSGEPLSIAFEDMIIGPSVADLISAGRLSRFRMFAPSRPDMSQVKRIGGDFSKEESAGIMDKPSITGDAVQHYARHMPGRRAIVFCVSVAHAEHVAEQFRDAGWPASSLDGGMKRENRRRLLADFAAGNVKVLTSCDIVSEGFDVPAIEVAILLRPTESLALYLQQVGRSLRIFPGKDYAWIFDHAGNSLARDQGGRGHGFPDDPREWTLNATREQLKALRERTIPTVICGRCYAIFRPQPCCPYCGHERDIRGRVVAELEGELEEVNPDLVRQAREEEKRAKHIAEKIEERQCMTLADWRALGKKRGHAPGWGDIQYRVRKKKKAPA